MFYSQLLPSCFYWNQLYLSVFFFCLFIVPFSGEICASSHSVWVRLCHCKHHFFTSLPRTGSWPTETCPWTSICRLSMSRSCKSLTESPRARAYRRRSSGMNRWAHESSLEPVTNVCVWNFDVVIVFSVLYFHTNSEGKWSCARPTRWQPTRRSKPPSPSRICFPS